MADSIRQVGLEFVVAGEREATNSLRRFGDAQEDVGTRIVKGAQLAKRLERQYGLLDRAFNSGKISAQGYASAVRSLDKQIDMAYKGQVAYTKSTKSSSDAVMRATRSTDAYAASVRKASVPMNQFGVIANNNTRQFKRFGAVGLQQLGYQVGDFAVQVQGGTSAFVALGQQGSQLLGIFGPYGAIAGAFLAVATSIANVKSETGGLSFEFQKFWKDVRPSLEPLVPLWNGIKSVFVFAGGLIVDAINLIINAIRAFSTVIGAIPEAVGASIDWVVGHFDRLALKVEAVSLRVQAAWQSMMDVITGSTARITVMDVDAAGNVITKNVSRVENLRWQASNLEGQAAQLDENLANRSGAADVIGNALAGFTPVDLRDYFGPGKGKKGKGGASESAIQKAEEYLRAAEREARLRQRLIGLSEDEQARMERKAELVDQLDDYEEGLADTYMRRINQTVLMEERTRKLERATETFTSGMERMLMSVVDGTKSIGDAFRLMLRDIILEVYRRQVAQPFASAIGSGLAGIFGGLFANGAAFRGGNVIPFADGGVVSSPTTFPMSGSRTGVMGEAGPEAIMPLKKTKSGKLGVVAEGTGDINIVQNFNFSANGDDSVRQIIRSEMPRIAEVTSAAVAGRVRRGGSYSKAFS